MFDPQDDREDNPHTVSQTPYLKNGDYLRFLEKKLD